MVWRRTRVLTPASLQRAFQWQAMRRRLLAIENGSTAAVIVRSSLQV